jgi:multidrug transporter EmrE-like cation transporter
MKWFWVFLAALLFATGDFFANRGGERSDYKTVLFGAFVGGFGYFALAYVSKAMGLASLAGYANGIVVALGVAAGVFIKKESISAAELFFLAVILMGIVGLATVQSHSVDT